MRVDELMLKNVDLDSFAMHLAYFYSIFHKTQNTSTNKLLCCHMSLSMAPSLAGNIRLC